jgi:UDP-N-acetylglucosamine 1-carboxyvinyltransferase
VDRFVIDGPVRLEGEVAISGAKNAALPCLAASLLTAEPVSFTNLPDVATSGTLRSCLQHIGAKVEADRTTATIEVRDIGAADAPYDLVKTMRASVLVLGPLLARRGLRARVAAGRLRDRRAADQPPPRGVREARRGGQPRARLRRGEGGPASGARDRVRHRSR